MARAETLPESNASVSVEKATRDAEASTIAIADVTRDPELNCRATGLIKSLVREYSEAMKAGATFEKIVIFTDSKGVNWLSDGFHRCAAAELAGIERLRFYRGVGIRPDSLLIPVCAK
jgi:hypothetical protein